MMNQLLDLWLQSGTSGNAVEAAVREFWRVRPHWENYGLMDFAKFLCCAALEVLGDGVPLWSSQGNPQNLEFHRWRVLHAEVPVELLPYFDALECILEIIRPEICQTQLTESDVESVVKSGLISAKTLMESRPGVSTRFQTKLKEDRSMKCSEAVCKLDSYRMLLISLGCSTSVESAAKRIRIPGHRERQPPCPQSAGGWIGPSACWRRPESQHDGSRRHPVVISTAEPVGDRDSKLSTVPVPVVEIFSTSAVPQDTAIRKQPSMPIADDFKGSSEDDGNDGISMAAAAACSGASSSLASILASVLSAGKSLGSIDSMTCTATLPSVKEENPAVEMAEALDAEKSQERKAAAEGAGGGSGGGAVVCSRVAPPCRLLEHLADSIPGAARSDCEAHVSSLEEQYRNARMTTDERCFRPKRPPGSQELGESTGRKSGGLNGSAQGGDTFKLGSILEDCGAKIPIKIETEAAAEAGYHPPPTRCLRLKKSPGI